MINYGVFIKIVIVFVSLSFGIVLRIYEIVKFSVN